MADKDAPITFEDMRRALLGDDEYKRVTQREENEKQAANPEPIERNRDKK